MHPRENEPRKLTLELRPEVYRLLLKLRDNGLFGTTVQGTAEQLLQERLREIVLQGWVGTPGSPDGRTQPLIRR